MALAGEHSFSGSHGRHALEALPRDIILLGEVAAFLFTERAPHSRPLTDDDAFDIEPIL